MAYDYHNNDQIITERRKKLFILINRLRGRIIRGSIMDSEQQEERIVTRGGEIALGIIGGIFGIIAGLFELMMGGVSEAVDKGSSGGLGGMAIVMFITCIAAIILPFLLIVTAF